MPKLPHWFQRDAGIKPRVIQVNQDHVLKYIAFINLLDPINKAE